ncbi:MAG: DUF262 domain-containing protein [Chloroflexi bacterium]|nr:DUF262 domain-containing protein [Chloroflexota bacterium]MBV9596939.1 DUF262 domain-containing protein [Chloroflexota bacterium]
MSDLDAELVTVGGLFDDSSVAIYTVPVCLRNFAWRAEQIEQLISDIRDAITDNLGGCFLGSLIVTRRTSTRPDYEIVDGQQRLTTLYPLLRFLAQTSASSDESHEDRVR